MSFSISDIQDLLLTNIVTYGAIVLAAVFLIAAVGVPLPSTVCVVAGGAFVQQGVLTLGSTLALGLAGVLIGDCLSYGMGHRLRGPIVRRFGQTESWQRAATYFERRGGLAIFLTRCVLTPIAVPINLIGGSSRYPFAKFFGYDLAGELVWLLGYGALGYAFGSQWETISELLSNASGALVGIVAVGVGAYFLIRRQRTVAVAQV